MHELEFLKVVSDESDSCSYLPAQTARMPLYVPRDHVNPARFDQLLDCGYRRSGWFFYTTQCPNCQACEPLRVEVDKFRPSRSQNRAQKLGDRHLRTQVALPDVDSRRLEIFNRHRNERHLNNGDEPINEQGYRSFLIHSHTDVVELSLWQEETLVAISITDVGETSFSAVYCFFDPDYAWLNPGTYAILQQIALARRREYRWLYLGMMVAENRHLKYKTNYRPHQRRIGGQWLLFE